MYHITFGNSEYSTALLIKQSGLTEKNLVEHYLEPLKDLSYDTSKLIAFSLTYDKKKPSAACRKDYLAQLLPALDQLSVKYLLCADGEYFKTLTKNTKAEPHIGYVLPCAIKDFEHLQVVYVQNYQSYFYNPDNKVKTQLSLEALVKHSQGTYEELGTNVLKEAYYPQTTSEIAEWLQTLKVYPQLTCDIEAFSLKHYNAGIGTISFAWNKHEGIAFAVDAEAIEPTQIDVWDKKDKCFKKKTAYIKQGFNSEVRELLKQFFEEYEGTLYFHNISYDGVVLTYQLWMEDVLDRVGLYTGREVILKNSECTQLITYLATNSCAGNHLSLKDQAHEFAGNYALDVKDIRLQSLPDLLQYNLIDTCSTWFVYEKNYLIMEAEDQLEFYETIFKPALWDIFEMHLTGMCLNLDRVQEVKHELQVIRTKAIHDIASQEITEQFIEAEIQHEVDTRNAQYKKKVIDASEAKFRLNLNSPLQLQRLLFDWLKLPVLDKTATGQPATGGDTLKKLLNHTKQEDAQIILKGLIAFTEVEKILTSFITSFESDHFIGPDGVARIYGSFKLGGTLSGRLSSSNPNIQQMPSGSTFGKLIKSCFIAPPNMVFGMSDFSALEDVVNTLLTKDPNKVKTLVDGFDGHSLRCYNFWPEKFPNIDPENAENVNSIAKDFADDRSKAKAPHFALQYLGTWATLVANCGFSDEEAKQIEARYKELYKVSFDWVDQRIQEASERGYAIAAFGLRIRTPLLHQVVLGNSKTPKEASAESRSLGNAVSGQSYGLLNGRASVEFMQRVRTSKYKHDIWLCAHIHDAIYLYWTDDLEITEWVNTNLIECMAWNELPELQHPQIKLSSELDIAYPTWADPVTFPNKATQEEILQILYKEKSKREEKKKEVQSS